MSPIFLCGLLFPTFYGSPESLAYRAKEGARRVTREILVSALIAVLAWAVFLHGQEGWLFASVFLGLLSGLVLWLI